MCILRPPITDKKTLLDALEKADIERIQVFEDAIDGSQVTSYIKRWFSGDDQTVFFEDNRKHSVIVITNRQKPKWNTDHGQQ
jgi:hypothetical protein